MKHINITSRGSFLGVSKELLVLKEGKELVKQWPLRRIRTIRLMGDGMSISTNLLSECAHYGIAVYIFDFRGRPLTQISGAHQHAVVELRKHQMKAVDSEVVSKIAAKIIYGKVRNQRATLLYYAKAWSEEPNRANFLIDAASEIDRYAQIIRKMEWASRVDWQSALLGYEGSAARVYWQTIKEQGLMGFDFPGRTGRDADDVMNSALNFGYALLTSFVWTAVTQAGLEPYLGVFHANRPGKPSLILDIMEEYRPWTVDRIVMRMRGRLLENRSLTESTKKELVARIHSQWAKSYPYRKKRVRLEAILQRQVYRLCGEFAGNKSYQPYLFRW